MISKTYVKLMQVMNSIGKTYAGISDADTKKGFLSSLVDAKSFFLHSFVGDTVLIDAKAAREILLVFVFFPSFGPFVFFPRVATLWRRQQQHRVREREA
jgi:hypothetical protein